MSWKVRYREAGDKKWKWLEDSNQLPPFPIVVFKTKEAAEKATEELRDSCFEAEAVGGEIVNREIRMKGKGIVHFKDEHGRPRELKGNVVVDYRSLLQAIYVKIETEDAIYTNPPTIKKTEYLMPFTSVCYIEWDLIEQ